MSYLTRSRRRLTAGFALAALLFAHGAIASYGCLEDKMPEQMACEEPSNPAPSELLCRLQFQSETQTVELAKPPQLPTFYAPVLLFAAERAVALVASTTPVPARIAGNARPLNVLYSRFLI